MKRIIRNKRKTKEQIALEEYNKLEEILREKVKEFEGKNPVVVHVKKRLAKLLADREAAAIECNAFKPVRKIRRILRNRT